jgi:hypothetical protein
VEKRQRELYLQTLLNKTNVQDPMEASLYELVEKGLVDYYIDDDSGELFFGLSEKGKEMTKEMFEDSPEFEDFLEASKKVLDTLK